MNHLKKTILLFATSFILLGCNDVTEYNSAAIYNPQIDISEEYNKQIDYSNFSIDDYSIAITPLQLKRMLDNKEDFAYYFHNFTCDTCERIKPLLIRYVLETKNLFYSLDIGNDDNYEELQRNSLYTQIKDGNDYKFFSDDSGSLYFATPEFYFIKDGVISKKQLITTNMFNYSFFKKVMDKYLIPSTSCVIKTIDDFSKYRYVYYCNFTSFDNNKLYKEIISSEVVSIAIYRIDSLENNESKIVNQTNNEELNITNTTTFDNVLAFIANNDI